MTEQLKRNDESVLATADKRQERRDAAENRKRVLDVAQRLFLESGVEGVSMHQIALAAGVGQGTLYRRYAHKGELCSDLLSASADRLREDIEGYLAQSESDASALEQLNGLISRLVLLIETKLSLLAAIGDACWGDRRVDKFRTPVYQWMHRKIAALLDSAVANGELRALDASYTADALLAALSPDVYQFQREERGLTPEQIVHGICRLFTERPITMPSTPESV